MVTQQSAIEEARQFAAELLQLAIPLRKVILFGSFARNEQHEWSDIDLALVADTFTGFGPEDIRPFVRALVKHCAIEPHTFSPEQFTDWNPFVQEIKRTGIVIGEWEPTAPAENRPVHL
ncbi:Nucleotidyltransferase domain-containing protein [Hymenobacter daecheongensis DSM 21074]|uniref:Nucleotidyltransferase domain-containing protein n=1 Tax=Hymenobacter daecheongensis DSM 21074 TaxID=1121955 RepID=A0A1M6J7T5_9BACT|nr:nucleotidyltransferase domain-containing protein [Hymenobacter daecheongensis]SHJ42735.1 Nucleotidyltransferase domain-containing protein [Hymenobacter daecheongensis DSM 21074]